MKISSTESLSPELPLESLGSGSGSGASILTEGDRDFSFRVPCSPKKSNELGLSAVSTRPLIVEASACSSRSVGISEGRTVLRHLARSCSNRASRAISFARSHLRGSPSESSEDEAIYNIGTRHVIGSHRQSPCRALACCCLKWKA
jgi:hypothetical protein